MVWQLFYTQSNRCVMSSFATLHNIAHKLCVSNVCILWHSYFALHFLILRGRYHELFFFNYKLSVSTRGKCSPSPYLPLYCSFIRSIYNRSYRSWKQRDANAEKKKHTLQSISLFSLWNCLSFTKKHGLHLVNNFSFALSITKTIFKEFIYIR